MRDETASAGSGCLASGRSALPGGRFHAQWRAEFQGVLPDLTEDDICGSGFAITGYTASEALGGERALALFRKKLARRGIKLMLDFVPNHTALDHPWVKTHPDYYVEGGELLKLLKDTGAFHDGGWSQIRPLSAWSGNWTSDGFVAYAWAAEDSRYVVVVVNYADNQGQCRLCLPFPELRGKQIRLTDVMGREIFDRDGSELVDAGLYIDHDPWHFNIFELQAA
jgi:hypothetical protein